MFPNVSHVFGMIFLDKISAYAIDFDAVKNTGNFFTVKKSSAQADISSKNVTNVWKHTVPFI